MSDAAYALDDDQNRPIFNEEILRDPRCKRTVWRCSNSNRCP